MATGPDHVAEVRLAPQQQQQQGLLQTGAQAPAGQHHHATAPILVGLVGSEGPITGIGQSLVAQAAAPGFTANSHEEAAAVMDTASPLLAPSEALITSLMPPNGEAPDPAMVLGDESQSGPAAANNPAGWSGAPATQDAAKGSPQGSGSPGGASITHADGEQSEDKYVPGGGPLAHAEPELLQALRAAPGSPPQALWQHAEREEDLQRGQDAAVTAGPQPAPADTLPAQPPAVPSAADSGGPADAGAADEEQAAAEAPPSAPAAAPDLAGEPSSAEGDGRAGEGADREEAARQISDLVAQAKSVAGASLGAQAEAPADASPQVSGEDANAGPSDEGGAGDAKGGGEAGGEGGSAAADQEGTPDGGGGAAQVAPWSHIITQAALAGDAAAVRAAMPGAFPAGDDEEGFARLISPDGLPEDEGGGLSPTGAEAEAAAREAERGKGPNLQEQEDWAARGVPRASMPAPAPAPALAPDLCAQALGIPKVGHFLGRSALDPVSCTHVTCLLIR